MFIGFICKHDNKPILFKDCWDNPRCKRRCYSIAVLKRMAYSERAKKEPGKFSTTQILAPAYQNYLKMNNAWFDSPDNLIFMIFGSAAHYFLEKDAPNCLQEEYFEDEICSGIVDCYDGSSKTLIDYKFLGKYKIKLMKISLDNADDYIRQVNRYATLLRGKGFPVEKIELHAFCRDFRNREYEEELKKEGKLDKKGNPYIVIAPCTQFDVPLIPDKENNEYFLSRKKILIDYLSGGSLEKKCPDKETWGYKRCYNYCPVNSFCEFYNKKLKKGA